MKHEHPDRSVPTQSNGVCALCWQAEGHSSRCSVTKYGAKDVRVYADPDGTQARHDRLLFLCRRLLAAYEVEEREDGFPFSFELRDAHARLKDLVAAEHEPVSSPAPEATEPNTRLREGLAARGILAGRNPDGVDDTVETALMVIDELRAELAYWKPAGVQ